MEIKFTIPGRLPGMNQINNANRSHWSKGAKMKIEYEKLIGYSVPLAYRGLALSGVSVHIDWFEKDRRRDIDNIFSAQKMILDSLVALDVIAGDGQKHVVDITDTVHVDKNDPRIEVTITE